MKRSILMLSMALLLILIALPMHAQNFTFEAEETYIQQDAGIDTLVFHAWVKNISDADITIQGHRNVIHAPHAWQSSMCFGLCFDVDINDTYPTPIAVGDSMELELDVYIRDTAEDYSEIQMTMENVNNTSEFITITFTTDTRPVSIKDGYVLQDQFVLDQNYPNPFNPETTISYYLPWMTDVTLTIYNSVGQKVKNLVNLRKNAGSHSVKWNGTDDYGRKVSSGLYFYKLEADNFTKINKMVLIK